MFSEDLRRMISTLEQQRKIDEIPVQVEGFVPQSHHSPQWDSVATRTLIRARKSKISCDPAL